MMASDNRSSWSNPFGYTFADYPTNDPPSGPPLLDPDESNNLQSFFRDPDHYGGADLLPENLLANLNPGQDTRYPQINPVNQDHQWLYADQTFPTAYQPPESTFPLQDASYNQRGLTRPADVLELVGIPANGTPDEVLDAASTLFLYRANNQAQDASLASGVFQTPAAHRTAAQSTGRHASFPFHTPSTTSSSAAHFPTTNGQYRASFDNSTHNPHSHPHSHASSSQSNTPMYHFGTDNNFQRSGYTAPYEGLEDAAHQPHMDFVRNMVRSTNNGMSSVDTSVPHTPDLNRSDHKIYPTAMQQHYATIMDHAFAPDSDSKPKTKRRKTKGGEDNDYTEHTSPNFHNQSSPDDNNTVIEDSRSSSITDPTNHLTNDNTSKRRRASSAAKSASAALTRRNLTEEQKRSNHIRSEQKRRNIIKQGYQDLNNLVPNLKTGGFSKSAVLTETTRYLEEVQDGNVSVEQHLRSLAAARGLVFDDL